MREADGAVHDACVHPQVIYDLHCHVVPCAAAGARFQVQAAGAQQVSAAAVAAAVAAAIHNDLEQRDFVLGRSQLPGQALLELRAAGAPDGGGRGLQPAPGPALCRYVQLPGAASFQRAPGRGVPGLTGLLPATTSVTALAIYVWPWARACECAHLCTVSWSWP